MNRQDDIRHINAIPGWSMVPIGRGKRVRGVRIINGYIGEPPSWRLTVEGTPKGKVGQLIRDKWKWTVSQAVPLRADQWAEVEWNQLEQGTADGVNNAIFAAEDAQTALDQGRRGAKLLNPLRWPGDITPDQWPGDDYEEGIWQKRGLGTVGDQEFGDKPYFGYTVWIRPDEFLSLQGGRVAPIDFHLKWLDEGRQFAPPFVMVEYQGATGKVRSPDDSPSTNDQWKITGHEGRGRATAALATQGPDTLIPVEIHIRRDRYRHIKPWQMFLPLLSDDDAPTRLTVLPKIAQTGVEKHLRADYPPPTWVTATNPCGEPHQENPASEYTYRIAGREDELEGAQRDPRLRDWWWEFDARLHNFCSGARWGAPARLGSLSYDAKMTSTREKLFGDPNAIVIVRRAYAEGKSPAETLGALERAGVLTRQPPQRRNPCGEPHRNPPNETARSRKGPSAPAKALKARGLIRGRVLDYGSGYGADLAFLGAEGYDPSFEGYEKKPKGKFDTITATYVLNTEPPGARAKTRKYIMSLLKPGGVAYITVRDDDSSRWGPGQYKARMRAPKVIEKKGEFITYELARPGAGKKIRRVAGKIRRGRQFSGLPLPYRTGAEALRNPQARQPTWVALGNEVTLVLEDGHEHALGKDWVLATQPGMKSIFLVRNGAPTSRNPGAGATQAYKRWTAGDEPRSVSTASRPNGARIEALGRIKEVLYTGPLGGNPPKAYRHQFKGTTPLLTEVEDGLIIERSGSQYRVTSRGIVG